MDSKMTNGFSQGAIRCPTALKAVADRPCFDSRFSAPRSKGLRSAVASDESRGMIVQVQRFTNRLLSRPPASQSLPDDRARNSSFSSPFRQGLSLAITCEIVVLSAVVCLFGCSRPSTVSGFIVPVAVNSVDGHSIESRSHVGQKRLERFPPSTADTNASTSVVMIPNMLWIFASRYDSTPALISWVYISFSCVTMRPSCVLRCLPDVFSVIAPAGDGGTECEGVLSYRDRLSTRTPTEPSANRCSGCWGSNWFHLSDDGQSTKGLAGEVDFLAASWGLCNNAVRHGSCSHQESCLEQPFGPSTQRLFAFSPQTSPLSRRNY